MDNAARDAKNAKIARTRAATFLKRKGQVCRVYTVKIQENKLSSRQKDELKMMFVEARWLKNAILQMEQRKPGEQNLRV